MRRGGAHPVITSNDPRASTEELRSDWAVDDYFAGGPRELDWLGAAVVWHHRTIEAYVLALQGAGFALTALSECPPRRDRSAPTRRSSLAAAGSRCSSCSPASAARAPAPP